MQFSALLSSWRRSCPWLCGKLHATDELRTNKGTGGKMATWIYDAATLALIDARMKAQAEGIWFKSEGGQWFSAEQVRNNDYRGIKLREYLTRQAAIKRFNYHDSFAQWATACPYLPAGRLHTEKVKTFAALSPRSVARNGRGFEVVFDAVELKQAIDAKRDEEFDKSKAGAGHLAPASFLARELGIDKREFKRRAAVAGLRHSAFRRLRSGSSRRRTKLFDFENAMMLDRPISALKTDPPEFTKRTAAPAPIETLDSILVMTQESLDRMDAGFAEQKAATGRIENVSATILAGTIELKDLLKSAPAILNVPEGAAPAKEMVAAAMLKKHPHLSDRKIAAAVGCHHGTLTRSTLYQQVKAALAVGAPPMGMKNEETGDIEAFED